MVGYYLGDANCVKNNDPIEVTVDGKTVSGITLNRSDIVFCEFYNYMLVGRYCGDNEVNGEEECDDGNNVDGDGCSANCQEETVTIEAFKIVCESEADLPNWGTGDGPEMITASTALDYVAVNQNCELVTGWDFQWSLLEPVDEEKPNGDHVGPAPEVTGFINFDTSTNGTTPAVANIDLNEANTVWVREILPDTSYIPFTSPPEDLPGSDVSAELYCFDDVVYYDNYAEIIGPVFGDTYYCVAFNALKETPPEPVCGNQVVEYGEQCDDGNTESGDGCSATCQNEGGGGPVCGNNIVESGEQCDDGNTESGDGCSATCQNEGGGGPYCGNGIVEGSEQCDDGNTNNSDSCSNSCTVNQPSGGGGGGGGTLFPTDRASEVSAAPSESGGTTVLGEVGAPVLALTKSIDQKFVNPGDENVTYTVNVSNTGNLTAFNVTVTDILPSGLTFSDGGGVEKTWEIGDLAPGESKDISYMVDVASGAEAKDYTNTVTAQADNHSPVTAEANLTVEMVAGLSRNRFQL